MKNHQDTRPGTGYPPEPPVDTSKQAGRQEVTPKWMGRFFNQQRCGYCGHDFGQVVEIAICTPCDEKIEQRKASEKVERTKQRMAERMIKWAGMAGKFSHAAPSKLPTDNMRKLLELWQPGRRLGVTITGDGLGKSWLIWLLLKKAWAGGLSYEAKISTEMRGEIMSLARNGDTAPIIRRLSRVPVLAIDDFGLATPTPAADELWAKLLEMRAKAGRPTLIASPYDGGHLAGRFSDPTAGNKILKLLGTSHGWVLDTRTDQLHSPTS